MFTSAVESAGSTRYTSICRIGLIVWASSVLAGANQAKNNANSQQFNQSNLENLNGAVNQNNQSGNSQGAPTQKAANNSQQNASNSQENAQSQSQSQSNTEPEQQQQQEDEDETDNDATKLEYRDAFFYDSRKNPHPRFASSHATKRLILTFQKPKEEKLNLCVKDFRAAADTAGNADAMVQTMKLMKAAVSKNIEFYHWCFYHFMTALDWKLEEDSLGLQLQDKMTIFIKNMKGLWLLARSLDEAVKSKIYFEYIKVRYLELSQAHFGRTLEVISPPLGDPRWIEPTKYFRPAGAFDR